MRKSWSSEHLARRADRYRRLAAATTRPDARRRYVILARLYRLLWDAAQRAGGELAAHNGEHLRMLAGKCRQWARLAGDRAAASFSLLAIECDGLARKAEPFPDLAATMSH